MTANVEPLRVQQSDLIKYPNHKHGSKLSIPSRPQSHERVCTYNHIQKNHIMLKIN